LVQGRRNEEEKKKEEKVVSFHISLQANL